MVNMGEKVPLRTKKEVQDDSIMGVGTDPFRKTLQGLINSLADKQQQHSLEA